MDKAERGAKHACVDCGIKYYDLNKPVVACPRCGAPPAPGKLPRSTRPAKKSSGMSIGRYP